MLSIHTGMRKLSKTNVYNLHLKIIIHLILVYHVLRLQRVNYYLKNIEWLLVRTNITLRFKMMMQYSVTKNYFDFMRQRLNFMDGLYMHEKCLLIDTIKKYQLRKQSAAEIEK